jgi:hypothetical protein
VSRALSKSFPLRVNLRRWLQAASATAARRNKAKKKAKDKYADQDEEDRQLAMQLLGSAGMYKRLAPSRRVGQESVAVTQLTQLFFFNKRSLY